MITETELKTIAKKEGYSNMVMEKDYSLTWLLKAIYDSELLKKALVFKGGTLLRKAYFPEKWRLSEDLDFTLDQEHRTEQAKTEQPEKIKEMLEKSFELALEEIKRESGIEFRVHQFNSKKEGINGKVKYKGIYANTINIDINTTEKIVQEPKELTIKKEYSDIPEFKVRGYTLEEAFIEKLRAIHERGCTRDYYDVWRMIQESLIKPSILQTDDHLLQEKFANRNITYCKKEMFNAEKLTETSKHWNNSLDRLVKGEVPDFKTVIKDLKLFMEVPKKQL